MPLTGSYFSIHQLRSEQLYITIGRLTPQSASVTVPEHPFLGESNCADYSPIMVQLTVYADGGSSDRG